MQCHAHDGGANVPMAPHDARSRRWRSPSLYARVPVAHAGCQSQIGDACSTIDAVCRPDQLSSRQDAGSRSAWTRKGSMRVLRHRKSTVRRLPDAAIDGGSGQYKRAKRNQLMPQSLPATTAAIFLMECGKERRAQSRNPHRGSPTRLVKILALVSLLEPPNCQGRPFLRHSNEMRLQQWTIDGARQLQAVRLQTQAL